MIEIKERTERIVMEIPTQQIKKKNSWFARKILGQPNEYVICEIDGPPNFPPIKIKITDEIDVQAWMDEVKYIGFTPCLDNPLPYKKTLRVTTVDGVVWELYGAFPLAIEVDMVKIQIDKGIVISKEEEMAQENAQIEEKKRELAEVKKLCLDYPKSQHYSDLFDKVQQELKEMESNEA